MNNHLGIHSMKTMMMKKKNEGDLFIFRKKCLWMKFQLFLFYNKKNGIVDVKVIFHWN